MYFLVDFLDLVVVLVLFIVLALMSDLILVLPKLKESLFSDRLSNERLVLVDMGFLLFGVDFLVS